MSNGFKPKIVRPEALYRKLVEVIKTTTKQQVYTCMHVGFNLTGLVKVLSIQCLTQIRVWVKT